MKRGDKFIISKQIGNVLFQRPTGNVAEIKGFLDSNVLFAIGSVQYILPIEIFKQYIMNSVKNKENAKNPRMANLKLRVPPITIVEKPKESKEKSNNKENSTITTVEEKPKEPNNEADSTIVEEKPKEPDNTIKPDVTQPEDESDDLYDDMDSYI